MIEMLGQTWSPSMSEGEWLALRDRLDSTLETIRSERHTIAYRLKDLEQRLDPNRFIRLGRGTLANISMIKRVSPLPGGTYVVTLTVGGKTLTKPVTVLQDRWLAEK